MNENNIKNMIFASLFAALYVVGTMIRIPFPVVPLVLTNMFLLLSGFVLGPLWGTVSVGLYLLIGILGLPIFSGGGGIGVFFGPTGGYLVGYILCALIAGLFRNLTKGRLYGYIIGAFFGLCAVYLIGIPWLKWIIQADWLKSISVGLVPFIFGDIFKCILAVSIIVYISKYSPQFLLNARWTQSNGDSQPIMNDE